LITYLRTKNENICKSPSFSFFAKHSPVLGMRPTWAEVETAMNDENGRLEAR